MKAYVQVELDDQLQKNLKQPTRMLYEVKPATGIYQRLKESELEYSRNLLKMHLHISHIQPLQLIC